MIYSLSGKIIKKTLNAVVVSCGGVGYYVQCPTSVAGALPGVGREATLYTVMSVTENDISLYGFATEEQQSCFELLTAVSGVGPKVGLAILSVMEPDRVALAISAGDHKAFKTASGVGPKLAQRIVLELNCGAGLAGVQPERSRPGRFQDRRKPSRGRDHQAGPAGHGRQEVIHAGRNRALWRKNDAARLNGGGQ